MNLNKSQQRVIYLSDSDALLVVDAQMDFFTGGALAITDSDAIIPVLRHYICLFHRRALPVIATRDWHPENHCSFAAQGGLWPTHCVAGTPGAKFATELGLVERALIISKATVAGHDAYSGFDGTDLHSQLQQLGVKRLFTGGLATDYCVLHTVLDALALGYKVFLLRDAVRAAELHAGDGDAAITRMLTGGATMIRLEQVR